MGSSYVKPAEAWHIPIVAQDMRDADRLEVLASHGMTPQEALEECIKQSDIAFTGFDKKGVPMLMFGAGSESILDPVGIPWMLTAENIYSMQMEFLRVSRYYVFMLRKRYPLLENYVDARYDMAVRWLAWCGFTIHEPEPYGVEGQLFRRFTMKGF